jgi:pimeloyl-ACP methyl ester carboxylesterase
MSVAEEIRIPIAGGFLAAKTWGDRSARPLLAVHGWLDNAGSFDPLAPLLAADRHVVAIDLRGHGRSTHLPPGGWSYYVDYFDDLHAVFDHFGWQRADLIGHSLGGTLASLFAAIYPERVDDLVLIEALGPLAAAADNALAQLRRALDQRRAFAGRKPLRIFSALDDAIAARMTANGLSAAAARTLVERGVVKVDGGFTWASDPRLTLASPQRFTEAQVLAMLQGIAARTLLMLAQPATSYLGSAMMDARAAQVAQIRVVHLPGNHHLHLEQADAVAAVVLEFLGERAAADASVKTSL